MVRHHAPYLLILLVALSCASRANTDDWAGIARSALGQLQSSPNGSWACTVESTRNGTTIMEQGKCTPSGKIHWALITVQGREPTAEETRDHEAFRTAQPSPLGVNFQAADLDLGSVSLVHQGGATASVRVGFREAAIRTDRLLGHLELTALVDLRTSRVMSYSLFLGRACSPVLGVRLKELELRMDFDREGAPMRSLARSRGSVFFRGYSEQILVRFRPSDENSPSPVPSERERLSK